MTSLWGKLPEVAKINTPGKILAEQAAALGEMSSGIIVGEITKSGSSRGDVIYTELRATVPLLNNYRIRILRVSHGILSYPCDIQLLFTDPVTYSVVDEGQLVTVVHQALNDERLLLTLSNAIAQATAASE
jgi:hypothetical protein